MNKKLGQFFTPNFIVKQMVELVENTGSILEPSAGDGAFLQELPKTAIGVEIDPQYEKENVIISDFFDFEGVFDTIIGNPPYIRYQDIPEGTKKLLPDVLDKRSNLYLFFIWKSIDMLAPNGEMIFIVPRDFIQATSASSLNERLYKEGGFTYWEEHGDKKIFKDATPNTCIFRWVKGATSTIPLFYKNGLLSFTQKDPSAVYLHDLFQIFVGGASGANSIFYNEQGNIDLVYSETVKHGQTRKAFYVDQPNDYLLKHKEALLARKIKSFNEQNWFQWGRNIKVINGPHIYVNMKTRVENPFFSHNCNYFDGSVLGLIPLENNNYDIDFLVEQLNKNNWEEQGLKVGGRFIFGQKSLSNAYIIL